MFRHVPVGSVAVLQRGAPRGETKLGLKKPCFLIIQAAQGSHAQMVILPLAT